MNDIRKTIGYADYSWNPVTGCHRGCGYCYARGIATRFRSVKNGKANEIYRDLRANKGCIVEHDPSLSFPFGFVPTFYPHRLDKPARKKEPATIFVCDMGDLFGEWVPMSWIRHGLDAAEAAPWHQYLFLTKNPERYKEAFKGRQQFEQTWLGTTITSDVDVDRAGRLLIAWPTWASFEPLLGPITNPPLYLNWAVIGGLNHAKRPADTVKWAGDLIRQLKDAGIPVWVKGDLFDVFPYREKSREE